MNSIVQRTLTGQGKSPVVYISAVCGMALLFLLLISPEVMAIEDKWLDRLKNEGPMSVGTGEPLFGDWREPAGEDDTDVTGIGDVPGTGTTGTGTTSTGTTGTGTTGTGISGGDTGDGGGTGGTVRVTPTPVTADRINPADPSIADLIRYWIDNAEPPRNATEGANLRYTYRGNTVGRVPGGTIESRHETGNFNPVLLWRNFRQLDSVNHCTMEEYVIASLRQEDTSRCRGRYRPIPYLADARNALESCELEKAKNFIDRMPESSQKTELIQIYENAMAVDTSVKALGKQANDLYHSCDYDEAITILNQALAKSECGRQKEKINENIGIIRKAQKLETDLKNMIREANNFYKNCEYDTALSVLRDALARTKCEKHKQSIESKIVIIQQAMGAVDRLKSLVADANEKYRECEFEDALSILNTALNQATCEKHRTSITDKISTVNKAKTHEDRTRQLFNEANTRYKNADYEGALAKLNQAYNHSQCDTLKEKLISKIDLVKSTIRETQNNRISTPVPSIRRPTSRVPPTWTPGSQRNITPVTGQPRWVLVKTEVNPGNNPTEFIVGVTPDFYDPNRYAGSYRKWGMKETLFTLDERWIERGYLEMDVGLSANFDKPPRDLIPGQVINLNVRFSNRGTVNQGRPGLAFEYRTEGIKRSGTYLYTFSPYAPDFNRQYNISTQLTVPAIHRGEISIRALLWNSPCVVIWTYKAQESVPTPVPDSTRSFAGNWSGEAILTFQREGQQQRIVYTLRFTVSGNNSVRGSLAYQQDVVQLTGQVNGSRITLNGQEQYGKVQMTGTLNGNSGQGDFGITTQDIECVIRNMFNNTNVDCPLKTYQGAWSARR